MNDKDYTLLVSTQYVYLITQYGLVPLENIEDLSDTIKNDRVHLIVDHQLADYFILGYSQDNNQKPELESDLQKHVPISLSKTDWKIQKVSSSLKTKKQQYQAFVLYKTALSPLLAACAKKGIKLESISYLPWLLSKNITLNEPTIIILIQKKVKELVLCDQDFLYSINLSSVNEIERALNDLQSFAQETLHKKVKRILISSDTNLPLSNTTYTAIDLDLNELSYHKLLSFDELQQPTQEQTAQSEIFGTFSSKNNERRMTTNLLAIVVLITFFTSLFFSIVGLYFMQNRQTSVTRPVAETTSTQMPTPSPVPSPSFIPAEYSLQILNASGQAGIANETKELLESQGYTNIVIGNATTQEELTFIATQNNELRTQLIQYLQDIYEINVNTDTSEQTTDFDATIILGPKK